MIEIHPPKNSWHIGLMFALLIWITVNAFDYLETDPKGGLKDENGTLSVKKVKNKNTILFHGNGRVGVCTFHRCPKEEQVLIHKRNVTVKLDESNRIFQISADGNILFGKNDINSERSDYAFRILICLVLFISYLMFFSMRKRK